MKPASLSLSEAPFRRPLKVTALNANDAHVRLVLLQMGLGEGEILEKIRTAPLKDPFSVKIGTHMFSLRREIGDQVLVEVLP